MKISKVGIAAVVVIVLAAVAYMYMKPSEEASEVPTAVDQKAEPLTYTKNASVFSVTTQEEVAAVKAEDLLSNSQGCGGSAALSHFQTVASQMKDARKVVYNFTSTKKSQDAGVYRVTALENKAGYKTLDEVKKDWNVCDAGATYPIMVNANWMLFSDACSTGYDDGSGLPHGCSAVEDAVASTLKLN